MAGSSISQAVTAFIANKFLVLLGKVFEGQAGLHIDNAVQRLSSLSLRARPRKFRAKALRVITRARAPSMVRDRPLSY
jgi:hypothetical protein